MLKWILLSFFIISFISCKEDIEELQLLKYSAENKKYKIEIIEREFNESDSLNLKNRHFKIFNSQNQVINENNTKFLFYNDQNEIIETKSLYHRGWKTNILINKYSYGEERNLILITTSFNNNIDTIQIYKYNSLNQLIEKKQGDLKVQYKYNKNKLFEIVEFKDEEISKHSKFTYDAKGNRIIEDWTFNNNQKMRTYFTYNSKSKLVNKRDSSITTFGITNEYVEFLSRYYYDINDSLIAKKNFGRVLNEKEFKYRGKTSYEYNKL